jgi:3-phosphoshikimate 1-carboxyvinyltransferase
MKVDATSLHAGVLEPPISKSDAHRALALAWMLDLPAPQLRGRVPEDVRRIADGLSALGTGREIDCGDGAAPFRILAALAAFLPGRETILRGSARLAERPHAPLFEALRSLGAAVDGGRIIGARPRSKRIEVDGQLSSQYASALVLAGCLAVHRWKEPFEVVLRGPVVSRGYLDITQRWARAAGFQLDGTRILGWAPATLPQIPTDWSSLGYLLLMGRESGSRVDTSGAGEHPDRAVLEHLSAPVDFRVSQAPDLAPTLAAVALAGTGTSMLREVSVLRHKESDRLAAIIELAQAVGAQARLEDETLSLAPAPAPKHFTFDCRNDHRVTLSAVTLACLFHCTAELTNTEGVDKSFPGFPEQAARCGVRIS